MIIAIHVSDDEITYTDKVQKLVDGFVEPKKESAHETREEIKEALSDILGIKVNDVTLVGNELLRLIGHYIEKTEYNMRSLSALISVFKD
jgi:predicted AlkP superfamily phosphohydrolase/phosphomutase